MRSIVLWPRDILKAPAIHGYPSFVPESLHRVRTSRSRQINVPGRHEIEQGERFLEFRLDYLRTAEKGVEVVRSLVEEFPEAVVLATCRRKENHGHFEGSIEQQVRVLSAAIDAGARAVDLEIESAEMRGVPLEELRRVPFVVSYHNWESTPALEPVVRRLTKVSTRIYTSW